MNWKRRVGQEQVTGTEPQNPPEPSGTLPCCVRPSYNRFTWPNRRAFVALTHFGSEHKQINILFMFTLNTTEGTVIESLKVLKHH